MIVLLLLIILLIVALMFGFGFYVLKQREINPPPSISCPKCPDPPNISCPKCPDPPNVVCPSLPEIECPPCPKNKCKKKDERMMIGFTVSNKKKKIRDLFKLINDLLMISKRIYCSKKELLIQEIRKMPFYKPKEKCQEILETIKENLLDIIESSTMSNAFNIEQKFVVEFVEKLIELNDLLIPEYICDSNDKISPIKVKNRIIETIEALCEV